jgi:hypothetical protein
MILGTRSAFGWIAPLWINASSAPRELSLIPGVLSACIAAIVASQIRTPGVLGWIVDCQKVRSYTFSHLSRLVAFVLAGAFFGYLPSFIATYLRATAGKPDYLAIVGGFAVIPVWVCLGYAVGTIVRQPWATVTTVIVSLIMWIGPRIFSTPLSVYSISPVWALSWPPLGFELVGATSLFRIFYFVALALILAGFARIWRSRPKENVIPRSVRALGSFTPVLAIALVAVLRQPPLIVPENNPPVTCSVTGLTRVCVHDALKEALPAAIDGVEAITAIVPVEVPLRINELSVPGAYPGADSGFFDDADIWLSAKTGNRDQLRDQFATEIAYVISGWENCGISGENMLAAETLARALSSRAHVGFHSRITAGVPSVEPLFSNLIGFSDHDFLQWFDDNKSDISSCSLAIGS